MTHSALFDFSGKKALVTGGSRGIGAAVSRLLAASGAEVWINYREDTDSARRVVQEIEQSGGTARPVHANLLQPAEIRSMFQHISETGGLDFLIHSAALGSFKPVLQVRPNQWDITFAVNARALLLCAREAAELMAGHGGKIVSISSLGSARFVPDYGAIGASKAALESLTRSLAVELAPRGINVNAVSAGLVDTPTLRMHPQFESLLPHTLARTPAGRIGCPEDVAKVILFLCSPLADWVFGQTVIADGGLSLSI